MNYRAIIVTAIATTIAYAVGVGIADEAPTVPAEPKSEIAVAAIHRRDELVARARTVYLQAVLAADKQEMIELKHAMQIATHAENLGEAEAINSHIKANQDEQQASTDELAISSDGKAFTIRADQDWQDTVAVTKGERYLIVARGIWYDSKGHDWSRGGPDGRVFQGTHINYLEARVGDGDPMEIDSRHEFTATQDGMLQLEQKTRFDHKDGDGALTVGVRQER